MRVEVTMPKMGESITEGTIIVWHKQPGERVELDEKLLEIGTDKVDTEVPSPAEGTLAEIRAQEGDTVEVGTVIAVIETEVEAAVAEAPTGAPSQPAAGTPDAGAPDAGTPAAERGAAEHGAAERVAAEPAASVPAAVGATVEVTMPKMGESITEGTIIVWHKQPGERVELDEKLLEIGTDKVDTEVPSPVAGVLQEIRAQEGETVDVGAVIAVIATEAEAGAPAPAPQAEGPARQPAAREAAAQPEGYGRSHDEASQAEPIRTGDGASVEVAVEEDAEIQRKGADGRFYSPLVRSIAEKEGLSMRELESIPGTGREGRVTKEDVLQYLEARRQRPAAPAERAPAQPSRPAERPPVPPASATPPVRSDARVEIIEMDRMRQIIADHMVRSKATSAHVTSFAEADVTNLVRMRERNKDAFLAREGVKLTFTPFFVQAAVEALREHPLLNASVEGKRIIVRKDYHIGIAVALGKTGLVAPIVRDAGQKNLVGLARAASDLAERARNKQLQPDELQGGTFTLTNIGSLGSIMGTPIINQPQVAILAAGAIKKRPVVVEHPDLGDLIAIRHMMYVSLSYDHRIIDGAMGASFLQRFVSVLESYDPDADL